MSYGEMSTTKEGDVKRTNSEMSKMGYGTMPKPKKMTSMRKPKMKSPHVRKIGNR